MSVQIESSLHGRRPRQVWPIFHEKEYHIRKDNTLEKNKAEMYSFFFTWKKVHKFYGTLLRLEIRKITYALDLPELYCNL